ncbi:hypothetical protein [Oscillatoria acuminata]|uniref:hypothetical protein n=1 Tax=Oscillatoria acuminata TaxID=118323 RepID=UPI0002E4C54C|nr:hypothetical protein [Oscillatoria acuminata]
MGDISFQAKIWDKTPSIHGIRTYTLPLNVEAIRESPLHLGGVLKICGSPVNEAGMITEGSWIRVGRFVYVILLISPGIEWV